MDVVLVLLQFIVYYSISLYTMMSSDKEWLNNAKVFIDWALLNGWKKGLQIDRTNNDGNYEPSNCRFVTAKANCNNKRNSKRININ